MDNILSVRELNRQLSQVLEVKFPFVWVKGEVTNCARPSSGHLYFSLKDGEDVLNCVWFRGAQGPQKFDPLTGEVWDDGPKESIASRLCDGQEIICAGRLSIYAPRGQYQLIVELAEESGTGKLYAAFEALKKKLLLEGLFESTHKKSLPKQIRTIALITAPSGAVIQDFMRIGMQRGKSSHIHLYPSLVQGADAPAQLITALKKAQEDEFTFEENGKIIKQKADVIVFIRGGGSIQDLWAFNDEQLAREIFASPIPVMTGIGHEPDHTIADYVADLRGATPSHVAQILWQDRAVLIQQVDDLERNIYEYVLSYLHFYERDLEQYSKNLSLLSPQNTLNNQVLQVKALKQRLNRAVERNFHFEFLQAKHLTQSLYGLRPQVAQNEEKVVQEKKALQVNILRNFQDKYQQFSRLEERLRFVGQKMYNSQQQALENISLQLEIHNPFSPLEKGYILAEKIGDDGKKSIVRSIVDIEEKDSLCLSFKDGTVKSRVEKIERSPS